MVRVCQLVHEWADHLAACGSQPDMDREWRIVTRELASALRRAEREGVLSPGRDFEKLLRYLLAEMRGMTVMAALHPDRDALHTTAERALTVMRRPDGTGIMERFRTEPLAGPPGTD